MTRAEMNALVAEELSHVPTHPNPQQSVLRKGYAAMRKQSPGRKASESKSRAEVLAECIADLGESHPEWEFVYNHATSRWPPMRVRRALR